MVQLPRNRQTWCSCIHAARITVNCAGQGCVWARQGVSEARRPINNRRRQPQTRHEQVHQCHRCIPPSVWETGGVRLAISVAPQAKWHGHSRCPCHWQLFAQIRDRCPRGQQSIPTAKAASCCSPCTKRSASRTGRQHLQRGMRGHQKRALARPPLLKPTV